MKEEIKLYRKLWLEGNKTSLEEGEGEIFISEFYIPLMWKNIIKIREILKTK